MTSECRAYLIVGTNTVAAAAATGAGVLPKPWSIACVIIAAACSTFSSGLAKSPRDGKLSDDAAPPIVAVDVKTDTTATTTTHAEAPKE